MLLLEKPEDRIKFLMGAAMWDREILAHQLNEAQQELAKLTALANKGVEKDEPASSKKKQADDAL